ncbi:short-chain dehydrogenase [Solemya pervernicosa gill symbiont]|uniref:Short-chain dehydrogenase n=2 Tax=Gammaproteobacteria incertae sedis TaxID=118884 RepID=A0A1T2L481_9GAMM|nr:SDR family oxidoreductase [Candidatus Reidiella endopervernicosa]OOZ39840.1 short-chain dehydrogenase [Solemya pervernicosa gill symbiont]QKQ27483.1 SDR family oxidoreductase [Candidatus Reidiella endopervernicosa]
MNKKTILITGCSSGIGLCCAKGLAAHGWHVFATARKVEDVEMLKQLNLDGLDALQLDLNSDHSIAAALNEIEQRTGGTLDALFNNGAYGQAGAVEDLSREVLRAQFETNLFGTHELTRRVISIMRSQGHGRIVQNSSVLGLIALPFRGAYNASKFALEALTDTLRLELHDSNIEISLIEPGPVTSRFRANAMKMYQQNIDREASHFFETYQRMEKRLTKVGPAAPFTLPPEAVLKKLIHALESPRPKARYYVTFPTYLFATLKRLLPHRGLDWVLRRVSRGENR